MPFIEQLGQQAASQAVQGGIGTLFGLMLQKSNDRRQIEQQKKLQQLQIQGDKELTDYNAMKQLEMWRNTSYGPQMEELRKAGLNPGLIYGMGGGGGQSNQVATGNVQGGSAPTGGREIQDMIGMGIQGGLQAAQIENIKANTEKTKVETAKTAGVDTALTKTQTESLAQGIQNSKAQEALTRIDTELRQVQASVARQTINDAMQAIENTASKGQAEITQLQMQNQLDFTQMDDKIKLLRAQAVGALLHNAYTQAQIKKTDAEITKIANDIMLGWETLTNEQQKTRIAEYTAEFQSNHPGVMNVLGGAIQRLADKISKPTGERKVN